MQLRPSVSVATRMVLSLLALGLVACSGAIATYLAMEAQTDRVAALMRATDGPILVERLRAEVYAAVMESRGLYISANPKEAAGYSDALRGHLATIESNWRRLGDLLPRKERADVGAMNGAMTQFVEMRREIARVGVEQGAGAANTLGNNDANRSARTAFTNRLDQLARVTTDLVKDLEAQTAAAGRQMSLILLAATLTAVVLVMGVTQMLIRQTVSLPLRRMAGALSEMADGRFDGIDLPPSGKHEVGSIASAARVFLAKLVRNRELEAAASAARDARERHSVALEAHTQDFSRSVSGAMGSLATSTEGMRSCASAMADAVQRTRGGAAETAVGAEVSAGQLAEVAIATEALTSSVNEISRQVTKAADAARNAVAQTTASDEAVRGLSRAAEEINAIMRLIADIAGQTNLLALNATIEAARAGEAGRGFAVVASEVKQLAQQTAHATDHIGVQVAAIQSATVDAINAMQGVSEAIIHVDAIATAIAAAVEEQGAVTREISASLHTVALRNDATTRSMRDVSDVAEGASGSAATVLASADDVARVASLLRDEVDEFLVAIRPDAGDLRRFERVRLADVPARLRPLGAAEVPVRIQDISRGGTALISAVMLAPGVEVEVALPGLNAPIGGRIVRCVDGIVGVVFRQDPVSLARIDQALQAMQPAAPNQKAA